MKSLWKAGRPLLARIVHAVDRIREEFPCVRIECRTKGPLPQANQRMRICGRGLVEFGAGVVFGWRQSPRSDSSSAYVEARRPGSRIVIGDGCVFSNDAAIVSECETEHGSVVIGKRCVFGVGFRCYDSDFHGMQAARRNDPAAIATRKVSIGDDCFLGERVMVLKGVTLGDRCVVGAGSVVTRSFPADSLLVGNPARLVREIKQ